METLEKTDERKEQGMPGNEPGVPASGNPSATTMDAAASKDITVDAAGEEADRLRDANAAMRSEIVQMKARLAAGRIGVREERTAHLIQLAKLDDIDITLDGADEKIERALRLVLNDIPEWAVSQGTGGTGNHRRLPSSASSGDSFRDSFRQGMNR